ncbi:RidA family protein [Enterovirga aerilata]|nr:RidA family protein [Enterovirga sp. DB1703]
MASFKLSNPEGVHRAAPSYSLAAQVEAGARRVIVSGQVGMAADGTIPAAPERQIELAFENLRTVLRAHGLDLPDVAKTTVFLTDRSLLPPYREIRARLMGEHAPASTLLFVAGLAHPEFLVEIEAEAVA